MRQRIEVLDGLPSGVRHYTLKALDEITRPLTREEIDRALQPYLFSSQRRAAVNALANLDIVAIVYRPDAPESD